MKKNLQILYSGLGGHGNIAFSMLEGDKKGAVNHELLFYGIEEVIDDYKKKCKKLKIPYNSVVKKKGKHLSSTRDILKKITGIKPDSIVVHSSNAIIPALLYKLFKNHKCKVVFAEHQSNEIKGRNEWFLSYVSMIFANRVVFNSEIYRSNVKNKLGVFFRIKKTRIIPNGLDLDKYKKKQIKQNNSNEFIISIAARLVDNKDHETLIKAFKNVLEKDQKENLQLLIAGSGELKSDLVEITKKLGIEKHVKFLGLLSESELIQLYFKTSLYVHATLAETMSTSIMQAQSIGLPMIVSKIPGTEHMIEENYNAIFYQPKDINDLTEKITALIKDGEERERISKNARAYAEKYFSNELMFDRYLGAIK